MKQISKLFAALVIMTVTGIFCSCDELDNPVSNHLKVDTSDMNIKVGQTVTRKPSYQNKNVIVLYKSADPSIATVNGNGAVTGVKKGTTTITLTPKGVDGYYNGKIFDEEKYVYKVIVSEETIDLNDDNPIDQNVAQTR